jgi:hypothetical protein
VIRQTIKRAAERHRLLTVVPRLESGLEKLMELFEKMSKDIRSTSIILQRLVGELSLLSGQQAASVPRPRENSVDGE